MAACLLYTAALWQVPAWLATSKPVTKPRHVTRRASAGPVVEALEVGATPPVIVGVVGGTVDTSANLAGRKVALITGASTGIGLATVEGLAKSGLYSTIVLAGRNREKHRKAFSILQEKLSTLPQPVELRHIPLELNDLASVRESAQAFLDMKLPLNTLVLNAGVMALPQKRQTQDGHEYQLGVNHLSHFLLTNLLLDQMVASASPVEPARIISLSSSAHQFPSKMARGDLSDLQSKDYTAWGAYGQSKLANLLFAYELDRRCRELGLPVAVNAVHPGVVQTELARYLAGGTGEQVAQELPGPLQALAAPVLSNILKSPEEGARTSILLATKSLGKTSGRYWLNERPAASLDLDPTGELPTPLKSLIPQPKLTSYDVQVWEALWRESEKLVGLKPEDVKALAAFPRECEVCLER